MTKPVDLREVKGCMLLRVRRLARRAQQIYDRHLDPVALTINQFGLLAQIHAGKGEGGGLSLSALAEKIGMDPTTLNRNIKPLLKEGLAANRADPADKRIRILAVTAKGNERLGRAVPLWRAAEREVEAAVGGETLQAMNGLVDLAALRLAEHG